MSEQNREARDIEDRYRRSLVTIRAGLDPVPHREQQNPVIEVESSSTWSNADISTDRESGELANAPVQAPDSSDSEPSTGEAERAPAQPVRPKPKPQPKPKPLVRPQLRAKARARQLPRALDRLALLRRVREQRRALQESQRAERRRARIQRVEDRRVREQRRRLGLPTRSLD